MLARAQNERESSQFDEQLFRHAEFIFTGAKARIISHANAALKGRSFTVGWDYGICSSGLSPLWRVGIFPYAGPEPSLSHLLVSFNFHCSISVLIFLNFRKIYPRRERAGLQAGVRIVSRWPLGPVEGFSFVPDALTAVGFVGADWRCGQAGAQADAFQGLSRLRNIRCKSSAQHTSDPLGRG